jgi:hypothetical protein
MLIDRYLPTFDATHVCEVSIAAPPETAYAAIRETDLRDPVIDFLFALRELPLRLARRLRAEAPPPVPQRVTLSDMAQIGPGFIRLAEEPGTELVIGAVGRFWRNDYGAWPVSADEFISFREPGNAKLAISLAVRPAGRGSIVRYEARTAATDSVARRKFAIYWRLIVPGVALVMRRALLRIKAEAERRALVAA